MLGENVRAYISQFIFSDIMNMYLLEVVTPPYIFHYQCSIHNIIITGIVFIWAGNNRVNLLKKYITCQPYFLKSWSTSQYFIPIYFPRYKSIYVWQLPSLHVHFFYIFSHLRSRQIWKPISQPNFEKVLFLNILIQNLLSQFSTRIIFGRKYTDAVKICDGLVSMLFGWFYQKIHFPFFNLRRAHKYLGDL